MSEIIDLRPQVALSVGSQRALYDVGKHSAGPAQISSIRASFVPSSSRDSTYGLITNGEFEQDFMSWASSVFQGSVSVQGQEDGHSLKGCHELSNVPTTPATQGNRQVQIRQKLTDPMVGGNWYKLTFSQGRNTSTPSSSTRHSRGCPLSASFSGCRVYWLRLSPSRATAAASGRP